MTLEQLKITQEAVTLIVFMPFSVIVMHQGVSWNYLAATSNPFDGEHDRDQCQNGHVSHSPYYGETIPVHGLRDEVHKGTETGSAEQEPADRDDDHHQEPSAKVAGARKHFCGAR